MALATHETQLPVVIDGIISEGQPEAGEVAKVWS